jgi:ABC-type Fe3+-citrate transport system substrate-binding protein
LDNCLNVDGIPVGIRSDGDEERILSEAKNEDKVHLKWWKIVL